MLKLVHAYDGQHVFREHARDGRTARSVFFMKRIIIILLASLCSFFPANAAFSAPKEVVLKNVRFGLNEGRLRMVLDFENRPTYSVASRDGKVSLSIPRLNAATLSKVLPSIRYEGWIKAGTAGKFQTLPTITVELEPEVSVVSHGLVTDTLPYRIFLDFGKKGTAEKKQPDAKSPTGDLAKEKTPSGTAERKENPKAEAKKEKEPPKAEPKEPPNAAPKEQKETKPAVVEPAPALPAGIRKEVEELRKRLAGASAAPTVASGETKANGASGQQNQPAESSSVKSEKPSAPAEAAKQPPTGAATVENRKPAAPSAAESTKPAQAAQPSSPTGRISGKIGDYQPLSNVEVEQKILLDRAESRYKEKDFAGAYALFTQFREQYPDSPFMDKAAYLQVHSLYEIKKNASLQEKQETVGKYTVVLADYPNSPEVPLALYNTGRLYLDMTFYYEALSQFSTLAAKYPDTQYGREAQFWVAESTFQLGKYADARGLLQKFINTQPDSPFVKRATVRLAECYSRLNQPGEADRILKRAFEKWPDLISNLPADSYINLADHYMGQKDVDKAEEMLLLGVNMYPESYLASRMLKELAEVYEAREDFADAGTTYYLLLHRYPESDEAQWAKVKLAEFGEKKVKLDLPEGDEIAAYYHEPVEALEKLLQDPMYPFREDALHELARANMRRENYPKALTLFRQALLEFPASARKETYRRESVESMQRLLARSRPEDDAYNVVKAYETSFRAAGNVLVDPKDLMDLGNRYAALDLIEEAMGLSSKALENASANNTLRPMILETGADWRYRAGLLDEAVDWLVALMKEVPEGKVSPSILMKLARWRYDQKKYTEAATLFLKLLPPDNKPPDVLAANAALELGRLYQEMDFPANALLYLKRAEELFPPAEEKEKAAKFQGLCRLAMADSLLAQGRVAEAKDSYRKCLEGSLDSQNRAWAYYRLAMIEGKTGNSEARAEALKQLSGLKEASTWSKIGETMLRMDEANKRSAEVL